MKLQSKVKEYEIRLDAILDISGNIEDDMPNDSVTDYDRITQIANYQENCEICNECGEGVMFGSGRFVDRIPDANSIVDRKEDMNKPFPCGDFMCIECEDKHYAEEGEIDV